jgi:hypothetical protein
LDTVTKLNLQRNLSRNNEPKWVDTQIVQQNRKCSYTGTVVQMISFSYGYFPLVGRRTDTEMVLYGYKDIKGDGGRLVRQSERLTLTLCDPDTDVQDALEALLEERNGLPAPTASVQSAQDQVWVGTYTLAHTALSSETKKTPQGNNKSKSERRGRRGSTGSEQARELTGNISSAQRRANVKIVHAAVLTLSTHK